MSNGDLEQKRYMAYVDDHERDQANTQLSAASGSMANFFFDPLVYDDDPDPVDPDTGEITGTVRSWGNGSAVLVRPDERRELKRAVSNINTIAWKEEKAYGQRLTPDAYNLFIAEGQLRQNGSYVRASGLFKTSGTIQQTLTSDFALMTCWDREDLMINVVRSGDGNRLEVPYNGSYIQEVKYSFNCDVSIELQGVVNTVFTGITLQWNPGDPMPIMADAVSVLSSADKWGIAIRATGTLGAFTMNQGSWMGLYRVDDGTPAAPPNFDINQIAELIP